MSTRFEHWKSVPQEAGVYLLYAGDECVYVGRSRNMRRRIEYHELRGKFDRVIAIPHPPVSIQAMEHSLIFRHKPRYNRRYVDKAAFSTQVAWYWGSGRWMPTERKSLGWMRKEGRPIAVRKAS